MSDPRFKRFGYRTRLPRTVFAPCGACEVKRRNGSVPCPEICACPLLCLKMLSLLRIGRVARKADCDFIELLSQCRLPFLPDSPQAHPKQSVRWSSLGMANASLEDC